MNSRWNIPNCLLWSFHLIYTGQKLCRDALTLAHFCTLFCQDCSLWLWLGESEVIVWVYAICISLNTYTPCWPCSLVLSVSGLWLGQESCLQCHLLVRNEHSTSGYKYHPECPHVMWYSSAWQLQILKSQRRIYVYFTVMATITWKHARRFWLICHTSFRIVVTMQRYRIQYL